MELAAEKSGGTTDLVITDSRYTEARYSEAGLYKLLFRDVIAV